MISGILFPFILNWVVRNNKQGKLIEQKYNELPDNIKSPQLKKYLVDICKLNDLSYFSDNTLNRVVSEFEEKQTAYKLAQEAKKAESGAKGTVYEEKVLDPVKEKKANITTTIVMGVIYAIVLIIGILGICEAFAPMLSSMAYGENDMDNIGGSALSFALGWMFISFIPTIAYYFAFTKLYNLKKMPKIGIFLGGLVTSIAMIIVFLVVYKSDSAFDGMVSSYNTIELIDGSAWEQIFTIVVAHVGLLLTYLLTFVRLDANRINDKLELMKQRKKAKEDNSLVSTFKFILLDIEKLGMKLLILILKLKDNARPAYYALFTIVFTILCFFSAFICVFIIALLALILVILYFGKTISFMYTPSTKRTYSAYDSKETVYEINDGGNERKLTYYDSYDGRDRFKDDAENYWTRDENGEPHRE
ncbi:MAG TPA: hypothetical protein VJZ04_04835 [Lachnospiraceae bacterium]|nr:hypothetical protein [Lachnospiraceae bacterium]